jgi:hypothetical protein
MQRTNIVRQVLLCNLDWPQTHNPPVLASKDVHHHTWPFVDILQLILGQLRVP